MSADAFRPEHFREVILARMYELDLNNETVARAGGPSTTKMSGIRKAGPKPPRADIFRKLDVALKWRPGSARRVAGGGLPSPVESTPRSVDEVLAAVDDMPDVSELSKRLIRELLLEGGDVQGDRPADAV
jgi:hypothetical protein